MLAIVLVRALISRLQFAEDFVAPIVIKSPSKKRSFSASNDTRAAVVDFNMVAPAFTLLTRLKQKKYLHL